MRSNNIIITFNYIIFSSTNNDKIINKKQEVASSNDNFLLNKKQFSSIMWTCGGFHFYTYTSNNFALTLEKTSLWNDVIYISILCFLYFLHNIWLINKFSILNACFSSLLNKLLKFIWPQNTTTFFLVFNS